MSGYCLDCGNVICLCDEISKENTASIQDFYEKYKELEKENARFREALEFYADGASWQAFNWGDEIPMRSDRESEYNVCGMRARQALLKTEEA
jgi:hypothetical protein